MRTCTENFATAMHHVVDLRWAYVLVNREAKLVVERMPRPKLGDCIGRQLQPFYNRYPPPQKLVDYAQKIDVFPFEKHELIWYIRARFKFQNMPGWQLRIEKIF